jgi:predicted lipoprotein
MAGSPTKTAWTALSALALGVVCVEHSGCGEDEGELAKHSAEVSGVLSDVLADTWPEVISPALDDARLEVEVLQAAAQAWSEAIEEGDTGHAEQQTAQSAWRTSMAAWQVLELMQLGPAGSSLSVVGGEDLRDEIYSWPTTNACRVDQETAEANWEAEDFFELNLVNVTGLDALETVLFGSSTDNSCPSQVPPNSDGAWTALGESGIRLNKARYAVRLAAHILVQLDAIQAGWESDYAQALARAGSSGSPFQTEEDGLNAIFDALFYLELRTKDRKLAWPLGLKDCGLDDCTGMTESPLAEASHTWIEANLSGFQRLYTGGDGAGLDDLMIAVGQTQIHLDLTDALAAAQAQSEALQVPLDQALSESPAQLQALHDGVKAVTDVLKNDLSTMLMLQIPTEASGDND